MRSRVYQAGTVYQALSTSALPGVSHLSLTRILRNRYYNFTGKETETLGGSLRTLETSHGTEPGLKLPSLLQIMGQAGEASTGDQKCPAVGMVPLPLSGTH